MIFIKNLTPPAYWAKSFHQVGFPEVGWCDVPKWLRRSSSGSIKSRLLFSGLCVCTAILAKLSAMGSLRFNLLNCRLVWYRAFDINILWSSVMNCARHEHWGGLLGLRRKLLTWRRCAVLCKTQTCCVVPTLCWQALPISYFSWNTNLMSLG